jgi:predicted PurR-regulated permease PerM
MSNGSPDARDGRLHKSFLVLLVVAITAVFLWVIWPFVLTILLAAIASGVAYPFYQRVLRLVGGRAPLAALLTVLAGVVLFVGPVLTVIGLVTNEALRITENITPTIQALIREPGALGQYLERLPGYERLVPFRAQILEKAGELVSSLGGFLVSSLSSTTRGTVTFLFNFLILLYTSFFLLMDGPRMLRAMLAHLPLRESEKQQMVQRFVSVSRATLKGTIVIGLIQGTLNGLAFWAVGIQGSLFWGTVMVVLSILPVVGGALIWVPAAIILALSGKIWQAIALTAFCGIVVGSVDNLLRPRLVGRDTKMHDLMIIFPTIGGIIAFGPLGFIIGPIMAALFLTSWEIFGMAFRDAMPDANPVIVSGSADTPSTERVVSS